MILGDGHLSTKEFVEVMKTRKDSGFNEVLYMDVVIRLWFCWMF
jgi:hypothetical protein